MCRIHIKNNNHINAHWILMHQIVLSCLDEEARAAKIAAAIQCTASRSGAGILRFTMNVNECEVTRVEGEAQKMVILGLYPSSQLTSVPPSAPSKNLRVLTNVKSLVFFGGQSQRGTCPISLGRESSCKCTQIL